VVSTRITFPLTVSLLCLSLTAAPSELPTPYPYLTTSRSGRFYFKMAPGRDVYGYGAAYAVLASQDTELWSVSGWYSFRTFLSDDGRYLVSLFGRTSIPRVEQAEPTDPLVAFYDNGKLLAQHSIAQLIQDPAAINRSESLTYLQPSPAPGFDELGHSFSFVTGEHVTFAFDIRTGAIVSKHGP